jgi:hypothetical protein
MADWINTLLISNLGRNCGCLGGNQSRIFHTSLNFLSPEKSMKFRVSVAPLDEEAELHLLRFRPILVTRVHES